MSPFLHILYIGNKPEYFESIQKTHGYLFATAANNLTAVNYLEANKQPDVVICEYNLPGQNGMFLFDWMQARPAFAKTAFILLTDAFNIDLYKTAFTKRVDDYYVTNTNAPENIIGRAKFLQQYKQSAAASAPLNAIEKYRTPVSKRVFDIAVASSVLLLASPFLLLIVIAIRLESKGKVYYTAKRVGRKTFDFYKLRSMRTGSDELLKKLAKEKNQYNKNTLQAAEGDAPCPRCSVLPATETCSPVMFVGTWQICDYWYNNQKKKPQKTIPLLLK